MVFEDAVASNLFAQICGSRLRNYIACTNTGSLSGGHLKNLADISKKLPELQNVIFLPDGDLARTWHHPPKNLLALPGDARPETMVYRHLFQMQDRDPFWKTIGPTYSRQYAITSQGGTAIERGDDKDWVKDWFRNQASHWGRRNKKVFDSWINSNKPDCLRFCRAFLKLLKGRYKGDMPKDVIARTIKRIAGDGGCERPATRA